MALSEFELELLSKTPQNPLGLGATFGIGTVINAREAPIAPDEMVLRIEVPPEAAQAQGGINITERASGSGELVRIFFPVGTYRCPARLALYPQHQRQGPHGLHWALDLHKVQILELSEPPGKLRTDRNLKDPPKPSSGKPARR